MEGGWSYKEFDIEEGLKPGSANFQYFFIVSQNGRKKCRYCVWITHDALARFDPSGEFGQIVSAENAGWKEWVKAKIDQGDFQDRVLRFDPLGREEIDLTAISGRLTL